MKTKTELDHTFESKDDLEFTRYSQRSFAIAVGIGFMLSIGLIFIGVTYGENIDSFLKTKTGFTILVVVCFISLVSFGIWRIRKMF